MKTLTNLERIALAQGYPSHLFGFTPNQELYWHEPTMPFVLPLLNAEAHGLDPVACEQELAGLMAFDLWNDNMAPRFPHGTLLAGKVLPWGSAVQVGDVLAWLEPGEALDCFDVARVVEVEEGCLTLAHDNGGHTYRLPWRAEAVASAAYRLTHYVRQPVPWML